MPFDIWGYTEGVGGMGLMWVNPRSFIFEIPRGKLEKNGFLCLIPYFSIGALQKTNDLTYFRHFPPDQKKWAYTTAYQGPKNMGAMGAEGC